ncbi:M48 family peptidase [Alteromonas sediminis]|uniref:Putative beta-barrel assembly-enhancing protease n=1 Tax=Alteromonas sediminis TaxID=2259342 RepID=A0A3N5Z935_9ALTE|nr:M48 family metalloprotease [Alteromonas sediminis]RPJ67464.1 M48 family peptidase [Alteromonas sediminis]
MARLTNLFITFTCAFVVGAAVSFAAFSQTNTQRNDLPEIGVVASEVVTIDKEQIIGDALMRQLRGQAPLVHDPVLEQYIQDLGNRLVAHADNTNFPFTFFFINNNAINAFAFFGGHIGMHTGLIAKADNESEVASVLAHEIAHVTQRHIARRMQAQQRSSPLALASLIGGVLLALADPSAGMAAIQATQAASAQFQINYTRSNEQEADRIGIAMLARAGFDPKGAATFFSKLVEASRLVSKPPQRLLSHPLSENRVADARARLESLPQVNLPPSLAFQLAKARIQARYEFDERYALDYFEAARGKRSGLFNEAIEYGYALALLRNDKPEQAQNVLAPLLQSRPDNQFYLDTATDVAIALESPTKAIEMLNPHFALTPRNPVLALNLANAHLEAEQYEQAISILRDFLLTDKEHQLAHQLLSDAYQGANQRANMHQSKAEVFALSGGYKRAVDELQFAYNHTGDDHLVKQRIRARIKQFRSEEEKLKSL